MQIPAQRSPPMIVPRQHSYARILSILNTTYLGSLLNKIQLAKGQFNGELDAVHVGDVAR